MSERVLLLEPDAGRDESAPELPGRRLTSAEDVAAAFAADHGPRYWIAEGVGPLLEAFAAGLVHAPPPGKGPLGEHFIVVLEDVGSTRQAVLDAIFRRVVVRSGGTSLLPVEELAEAFAAPHRDELFIGGVADTQDEVVVLYRGSMEPLLVPFAWFEPSGTGTAPSFADFSVADFGQTVRFGEYEAAADAILYELDPEYRRRARKRLREQDRSFGACLRRLRLQKRVAREDFPGVSAKQVARIERGETGRPRASTLAAIAARLGVRPEEIEDY